MPPTAPVPAPDDGLEALVRQGAQRLRQAALEAEVTEHLGRVRYQRGPAFRGCGTGCRPARALGTGMGAGTTRQPRVRDVPPTVPPFESAIVGRYVRRSRTQARLLSRLSLEGLATGDVEPLFRAPVGETAALSPTGILRLTQEWADEYRLWRSRPLTDRYVCLFADALSLKAGLERETTAVLVVLGVRADGVKVLLARVEGYRESTAARAELLCDLRARGLETAPLLAVGDGALGWWAALDQVYPTTRHQLCCNHRALNVPDELPKRLQRDARAALHGLYEAPTRETGTQRRAELARRLRLQGQTDAAARPERDWEDFVTVFDFTQEHWLHLRTTNPIESVFAGVRLRTNATKRLHVRESALSLVFKPVMRLRTTWRGINGPNQLVLLLAGERVHDGQLTRPHPLTQDAAA